MYVCSECGYGSASWYGKCPSCGNWNTLKKREEFSSSKKGIKKADFLPLRKVDSVSSERIKTGTSEFDRVLGGGFAQGSVILLSGEPGVGKSTLLLKLLAQQKTFYVSGEESGHQVKQRAERLGVGDAHIMFSDSMVVESIVKSLESHKDEYDAVVIDSIQTVYSQESSTTIGSVSQIKESAVKLIECAKKNNKIMIIVGHVTKGGDIAGPKMLEHLVDCVLYLEGEKYSPYRLLRAHKNRFGPTDEVGVFEMIESGLREVSESTAFIDESESESPGRSLIALLEGSRVLFYEIQCLVVPTSLSIPRRVATGIDYNRLQLHLAVIRKYVHISLDTYDVYVNVVGGMSVKSPAADLGIIAAILSSTKNKKIPQHTIFVGEIDLLGAIRFFYGEKKIISESKRFGMKKIYSSSNIKSIKQLSVILSKS